MHWAQNAHHDHGSIDKLWYDVTIQSQPKCGTTDVSRRRRDPGSAPEGLSLCNTSSQEVLNDELRSITEISDGVFHNEMGSLVEDDFESAAGLARYVCGSKA